MASACRLKIDFDCKGIAKKDSRIIGSLLSNENQMNIKRLDFSGANKSNDLTKNQMEKLECCCKIWIRILPHFGIMSTEIFKDLFLGMTHKIQYSLCLISL